MKKIPMKPILVTLILLLLLIAGFQTVKNELKSPSELNKEDKTTLYVPKQEKLPKQEIVPMKAESYEFHVLAEGTDTGNPGDILQTIKGQGFYYTSHSPKIQFGEDLIIENTEVNKDGTELYVILSKADLAKLQELEYEQITIFMGEDPKARGTTQIQITSKAYMDVKPEKQAVLKYQRGYFVRE